MSAARAATTVVAVHLNARVARPCSAHGVARSTRGVTAARGEVYHRHARGSRALRPRTSAADGADASAESFDVSDAPAPARAARNVNAFTRTKEKDPYKRLGIDADSTSEEVSSAFNFLIREHAGDERGVEAIEAAYDRIISDRLSTRKKAKGLRKLRKEKKENDADYDPAILQRVKNMFAKPDQQTLIRRSVLYAIISGWAIAAPATSGPAFQMAVAFGTCVFFLNQKRGGEKTLGTAFRDSFIALLCGWLVGSIVPVYIPLFPQAMSPELILALFSFASLWVTCTFLK